MRTFRYLPPGIEEQRAFMGQLVSTISGLIIVVFLALRVENATLRGICWGGCAALAWMLGGTMWNLETKARRAAVASITIADDALHIVDEKAREQIIDWKIISEVGVTGGRLNISWPGGSFAAGAREIEDGLEMVRAILQKCGRSAEETGFAPPTNFIPLDPL